MATFTLTFSYNTGDLVDVWGHSQGVTTEDYEKDPSIDPYYVHTSFTATESASGGYTFTYDTERGYVASIYVNGTLVATKNIAAVIPESPEISSVSTGYTSITVYIDNATGASISGTIGNKIGDVSFTGSTCRVYFGGLNDGVTYTITISINGVSSTLTATTSSYPVFDWDTDIVAGASIAQFGDLMFAPVTAAEWNCLVDIVNLKCGTTFSNVTSGEEFSIQENKSPRLIADVLNVPITDGDTLTAQFFIDLKNAINNK